MSAMRFVAVDVETTGLYNSDRVVEVAAVTFARDGQVIDEWDTLVNPGRDVGPTSLHGINASMVSAAPRFEQVASALADRLHGSVLVAHNLVFDARMLANEYSRLDARLLPGMGVCTLSLSGERLDQACVHHGIPLHRHHRALADARAAAALATTLLGDAGSPIPALVEGLSHDACPRTLRRDVVGADVDQMPFLVRVATAPRLRAERGRTLVYLDMLDWALADLELSCDERNELLTLALELGMSGDEVRDAHRRYLEELVGAALIDGTVTEAEYALLLRAASALGVEPQVVEEATRSYRDAGHSIRLEPGMAICFTGEATYADGSPLPRSVLFQLAEEVGLRPVSSITKSGCHLVCAADVSSLSGKAAKARKWGIPVVGVIDFLRAEPEARIPVRLSQPDR